MSYPLVIELAWKSVPCAGLTLALLVLLRDRSAAERSWIGHAGLAVTLLLPFASLAVPRWQVEAPAPLAEVLVVREVAAAPVVPTDTGPLPTGTNAGAGVDGGPPAPAGSTVDWRVIAYGVPMLLLLSITTLAILRLVALRRRASVLVEQSWLSALAQAQRRMGFKHGTALLVSDDVASPVSWGVMRPVILLNPAAVGSRSHAEAIIAHELAHVARLDWAKLLLARVTTAVFWFNPLVWLLAKQCHQLREEAADDAVLESDVSDVDYAELLVGVARHESGALLLAANGVAPGRGSLKQRVARVLDTDLRRAPARVAWVSACAVGAVALGGPLAALSFGDDVAKPLPLAAVEQATRAVADAEGRLDDTIDAELEARLEREAAAADVRDDAASFVRVTATTDGRLPLPPFDAINIQGGGKVILRHGRVQSVRIVDGAADAARVGVRNGSLSIGPCADCDGGRLTLEVVTPGVEAFAIMGSGTIEAEGAFPRQVEIAAAINGGGRIDVDAIEAGEVAAAINGGGVIEAAARDELAASIRGGGTIRYRGSPEVATSTDGGGLVERIASR